MLYYQLSMSYLKKQNSCTCVKYSHLIWLCRWECLMVIIDFKHAVIEAWRTWVKVDIFYMISFLFKILFFPFYPLNFHTPILLFTYMFNFVSYTWNKELQIHNKSQVFMKISISLEKEPFLPFLSLSVISRNNNSQEEH